MMLRLTGFSLFVLTSLSTCVTSVSAQVIPVEGNLQRCLSSGEFDQSVDYFPSKFKNLEYVPVNVDQFPEKVNTDETTDLFTITYHNYYKIITNNFVNKTYLLYLCGTEPPASELDGRHHLVLPVPHQGGLAITSTTQIPYLELLGLRREVLAYIGDPQWVSSPCMRYQMDVEKSIDLYIDEAGHYNRTNEEQLVEQFLAEHPDAIIVDGPYGDADADRTIIAAATQERSTVATFDWIGYYAAFFNLEGLSNQIAAETKASYDCSASNAATLSADRTLSEQPVVLWANYIEGYNWSVAECPTWDHTYYCEYAAHCGARILSRPEGVGWNNPDFGGRYWYLNDDELLELGKDADIFIYPSKWWGEAYEKKKEMLDQIKAVQNKEVYDTQGQGPNSWHEQRLAEYEVVALDFCDLVGNANTQAGQIHQRRWFRNVFNEPIGSLEECDAPSEIDERYEPDGAECTPIELPNGSGEQSQNSETASSSVPFFTTGRVYYGIVGMVINMSLLYFG